MFKFFHMRAQWYRRDSITFIFFANWEALQRNIFPKIRDYYGSGWVCPCLTRTFLCGKSSQNSPKLVLVFLSSIPCVCCLYIAKSGWLLWFECSVHVSDGLQKKSLDGGGWVGFTVGGFLRPIQFVFVFLETNYLCKAPRHHKRQVDERQVAEKRGSRKRQYAPDVSQLMHPSVKWHRRQFTMLVISITLLKSMNDVSLILWLFSFLHKKSHVRIVKKNVRWQPSIENRPRFRENIRHLAFHISPIYHWFAHSPHASVSLLSDISLTCRYSRHSSSPYRVSPPSAWYC